MVLLFIFCANIRISCSSESRLVLILVGLLGFLPSIAARNYMLNVKLRIFEGESSFEIVGEVQITTVDYLQLKKVQHKLYDLDRILKGKDLEDEKIRGEVHASILKSVCGN